MAKKSKGALGPSRPLFSTEVINTETLDSLMGDRFAAYAKDVITDRAIPDVRDGLKPVQRRIVYDMWESRYVYNKPRVKCLKITGEVMGKYHPHGDTSIYEALVRLSQSWKMSMPLIDFKGNNDSLDADGPAAARYTEARLNEFANNLLTNLEKENVEMTLNYDDKEFEPTVLPAYFPNLYVNGSEGIAVGMATNIPPHNLNEMCDAVIYRIKHPKCTLEELLEIVKGPDFPTGGKMYKTEEIAQIYRTGKGHVDLLCKTSVVEGKDTNTLLISEIPFGVIKKTIPYRIDLIKKSNEVDGILEVRDLSEGDDVRIEVILKKDVDPKIIEQFLINKKILRDSYSANIVAIVANHPKTLDLISYIDTFVGFQVDVRVRGFKYDLAKAEAREHIVSGLIRALSMIDLIVKLIRKSKNKADAKINLQNKYDFTEIQAEAIVTMPLYKLTTTDVQTYIDEQAELIKTINWLKEVLASEQKIKRIIVHDLEALNKKYPTPRKTELVEAPAETISINKRDLISQEDVFVVITRDGYIKTSSLKSFKSSNNSLPGVKEGDTVVMSDLVSNMDTILAFTNKGNFMYIPVYEIQEGKWKDEGKHINYMCNLPLDESIVRCVQVSTFNRNVFIGMVSKRGLVKKTHLSEFNVSRISKPVRCMKLTKDDELADVSVLNGKSNILITTELGEYSLYKETQVTDTHLSSSGIKAIRTSALKHGNIISILSFRADERNRIAILTNKGCFRIYDSSKLVETDRLSRTIKLMSSFKKDIHKIVYLNKINRSLKEFEYAAVLNDNSILEGKTSELNFVPAEVNCKTNIKLKKNQTIKIIYGSNVQWINEKTIEEVGIREHKTAEDIKIDDRGQASVERKLSSPLDLQFNEVKPASKAKVSTTTTTKTTTKTTTTSKPASNIYTPTRPKPGEDKPKVQEVERPKLSSTTSSFLDKLRSTPKLEQPKKVNTNVRIPVHFVERDENDLPFESDEDDTPVSIFDDLGE